MQNIRVKMHLLQTVMPEWFAEVEYNQLPRPQFEDNFLNKLMLGFYSAAIFNAENK